MGHSPRITQGRRRACAAALALAVLAGCSTDPGTVQGSIEPDAVDVVADVQPRVLTDDQEAVTGPQDASGGGVNVGSVVLDGSTVAIVALAVVGALAVVYWLPNRRERKKTKAIRLLAMESLDRPTQWKRTVKRHAELLGIEKQLHRQVKKVD